MHVLVTGATGRIGANVVKRLVERGDQVRCQVRPGSDRAAKLDPFDVEIVQVDLTDREALIETVRGVDAIVHMGVKLRGPNNWEHLDINIAPTLTLLEAVRTINPGLKRFVYASSDALYPHDSWMPSLITDDDKIQRPSDMYKVSKVAGESIVQCYHQQYGIPTVSLNVPMTFCGAELLGIRTKEFSPAIDDQVEHLGSLEQTDRVKRTIGDLVEARNKGAHWVVPINPQGSAWSRHLGDVRDVVSSVEAALETKSGVGGAYVIMSDALNYAVGVPYLAELSGMHYAELLWPFAQHYWYDVSRTRNELGFQPQHDSRSILEDAWRNLQGEDIGVVGVGPDHPIGGERTL
jgi:dTDP-L-rhamnose 4-epimerase